MKLLIAAFGKLKTPGLREAADHYCKGLGTFVEFEELELKPAPLNDKSEASRSLAQRREAEVLLAFLDKKTSGRRKVVVLDERGPARSTQKWVERLTNYEGQSASEVVFFVGSSAGFSEEFRRGADELVSLGPQTLPHELARVVLLEQLFRAFSVKAGHPYHNEG